MVVRAAIDRVRPLLRWLRQALCFHGRPVVERNQDADGRWEPYRVVSCGLCGKVMERWYYE